MSKSLGRDLALTAPDIARWRASVLVTATCAVWMGAVGSDGYGRNRAIFAADATPARRRVNARRKTHVRLPSAVLRHRGPQGSGLIVGGGSYGAAVGTIASMAAKDVGMRSTAAAATNPPVGEAMGWWSAATTDRSDASVCAPA